MLPAQVSQTIRCFLFFEFVITIMSHNFFAYTTVGHTNDALCYAQEDNHCTSAL